MIKKNNRGVTLIETIFYIVLFSMLSTVVIYSIVTMTKSFKEISIQRELTQGGEIMERISREIRQANAITSLGANSLVLASKDSDGNDKSVQFVLDNSNIALSENGNSSSNLNSPDIKVSALTFGQVNTVKGKAVKISLTIISRHDMLNRSYDINKTIVLRGDY